MRGFEGRRSDLVPVLQRAQAALGYLSPDAVRRIARRLKLSESEVFGVATFYAQFRFTPPGRHQLRVCLGTACHVKGGVQMMETARATAGSGRRGDDGRRRVRRRARGLPGVLRAGAGRDAGRGHLRADERAEAAGDAGCRGACLSAAASRPNRAAIGRRLRKRSDRVVVATLATSIREALARARDPEAYIADDGKAEIRICAGTACHASGRVDGARRRSRRSSPAAA